MSDDLLNNIAIVIMTFT